MSLVDEFLLSSNDEVDSTFGLSRMVCQGQTFNVVVDDTTKSYTGALGGLEGEIQGTATAQPADVTDPKLMIQKRCTIDGVAYRVFSVSVGTVAITFSLIDINATT